VPRLPSPSFDWYPVAYEPITREEIEADEIARAAAIIQWRRDRIAYEQAAVDAALIAGQPFVVNHSGERPTVHEVKCRHAARLLDRAAAWAGYDQTTGPPQIELVDRRGVEQLPRYSKCRVCNPDVTTQAPRRRLDEIYAESIHDGHLGLRLITQDGVDHGLIQNYAHRVWVRTDQGDIQIYDRDRIVVRPDPTR
jgi:hypothetical protein